VNAEYLLGGVVALLALWLVWRWLLTIALLYRLVMLALAGWLLWRWWNGSAGPHLHTGIPSWALSPLLTLLAVVVGGIWVGRCRRADSQQQPQPEKLGVNVKS
jgi:hypothetical protein